MQKPMMTSLLLATLIGCGTANGTKNVEDQSAVTPVAATPKAAGTTRTPRSYCHRQR